MLPSLVAMLDGSAYRIGDLVKPISFQFSVSDEEVAQRIASGKSTVLENRLAWARAYLKKAGLVEPVSRGQYRITQRGLDVLKSEPERIDNAFLRQFPKFAEFLRRKDNDRPTGAERGEEPETQTPLEVMEEPYQRLRRELADELLQTVLSSTPSFFERLVVNLLVAMGYGGSLKDAGQDLGRPGDDGVDGVIKEDRLGLDAIYIQAKRWTTSVGRPDVQSFAGSLEGHRARKGVFITTSQFSKEAREYVTRIEKKIRLVDGEELAQLMIDFGVGVTGGETYEIKKLDRDYFEE
jgi:restriction system protein